MVIRAAVACALASALAAPVPAQLIGPNPGVIFVSPLGDPQPSTPPRSSPPPKAPPAAAPSLALLAPIRESAGRAARYAADADATELAAVRIRRLQQAVDHAASARQRLDVLRSLHAGDEALLRAADDLAFSIRKDLARYRRGLRAATARPDS